MDQEKMVLLIPHVPGMVRSAVASLPVLHATEHAQEMHQMNNLDSEH